MDMPITVRPMSFAAGRSRRHWIILIIATLLVRGVLFFSYPLPVAGRDDNQAGQVFLMEELADGNLLIGNVRYNTGYPLVMWPFHSLTRLLGANHDRFFLLIQLTAASAIPILVYGMMRRRFSARTALITALTVLLDPFGLQWAHLYLPVWLIALLTIFALWAAERAWSASQRGRLALVSLAAVAMGLSALARLNFAPVAAVFGLSFLLWRHIPRAERLRLLGLVGLIAGGILGAYTLFIQLPSTGTTQFSCVTGMNLLQSAKDKRIPVLASNGQNSADYALLLALPTDKDLSSYTYTFPYWRSPGPWFSQAEADDFLSQPVGEVPDEIPVAGHVLAPGWFLGPCANNAMQVKVFLEAISLQPLEFAVGSLRSFFTMLVQMRSPDGYPRMYLDSAEQIEYLDDGTLGFRRAHSALYKGNLVWQPGIAVFSALFAPVNLLKLLTPLALAAALWKRDWLLVTVALLLLAGLLIIALATNIEPRYYATLAPLHTILIGWFLADLSGRISRRSQ